MNYHLIIKLYENSGKLLEIEFTSLKCFDYIIYNDYNEKSENEIMDLVSKLMNKK